MKIIAQKSKYHRFSLYYDYTPDRVEFCRSLKDSFGWTKFSFEVIGGLKFWAFSDSLFVPVIKERFPEVMVEKEVEEIVAREQLWTAEQTKKNEKIDEIRTKKETNFKIKGLKQELYPYQNIGAEFLIASGGRAIIADAPGLGKTAQALAYIKHNGLKRTLVVSPASVKFSWENEVKKWTNLKSVVIDSKTDLSSIDSDIHVWIINYDVLKRHYGQLSKIRFDCIIGDEAQYCFPGETIIETQNGPISIKDIVENKMSLYVASCNSSSTEIEYKRVTGYQKNEQIVPLVRVIHETGDFICTGNHKIFSNGQWKEALLLRQGDSLQILPEEGYCTEKRKKHSKILQSALSGQMVKHTSTNQKSNNGREGMSDKEDMRMVQKEKNKNIKIPIKEGANTTILREIVFGQVEDNTAMGNRNFKKCNKESTTSEYGGTTTPGKRANDEDESRSYLSKETFIGIPKMEKEKSNIFASWWKWAINKTSNAFSKIDRNGRRISDKNTFSTRHVSISTNTLQGRSSECREEDCSRDRWKFPFIEKVEIFRQKENRNTQLSRVVSVEILEQRSDGKSRNNSTENSFVYNIEVEDNHNYFANGVLVSNCKSTAAIRTKAFRSISRNIPHVILLSGTPLLSRPSELFSLLNIIDSKTWDNWYDFARRYCDMKQTRWGPDTSGASNIEELHARIRRYFIRRDKSEVLKELPPKTFIDVPVQLSKEIAKEYMSAANDLATYLRQYSGKQPPEIAKSLAAEKLTQLNVLRHLNAMGKIDTAIELVDSILDAGEKVLVFCSFIEPLEAIKAHYKDKAVIMTGKTPVEDRRNIVETFQGNKKVPIFLGGIKSAGSGLTLTAASNVIFLDYSWTPSDHVQAENRIHRPGQTATSVNIYQLFAMDTIDEDLKELLEHKQDIFNRVIDGKNEEKPVNNVMDAAIKRIMSDKK